MGTHPIFESDFDCLTGNRMEVETNFDDILKLHQALSKTENNRIKCGITGHEMPAKEATVRQHICGKKFLRLAKEWKKPDEAQATNRTFLETHTKHENMLYCKLTGRSVRNEELEFRPMREWGQRSRQDREFEEMIGGNEGPDSDEDDCHDLYPWLKNGENDSGMNVESESIEEEGEGNRSDSRKRSKKGSV